MTPRKDARTDQAVRHAGGSRGSRRRRGIALGAAAALLLGAVPATAAAASQHGRHGAVDAEDAALAFDADSSTTITVTIDGEPVTVRWYQEVCYVADPVAVAGDSGCGYQSMNVYVPETAAADSAPIYLAVHNGGWFASHVSTPFDDGDVLDSTTDNVAAALHAGMVVTDLGTRSRGLVAPDGTFPGKAPAVVVDQKAAVRYLRLNDDVMAGDAERIIANGTSGGGAAVVALGASGNSKDYLPYLADVGAAGIDATGRSTIRDDIFAVNAYCPITDLGNADIAYEWLYDVLDTRETVGQDPAPEVSAELAAEYPSYLKSLGLRASDGSRLTAATMLDEIVHQVTVSAEFYMTSDPAHVIEGLDWIVVDNDADVVESVDAEGYLEYVATERELKPAPAFDQTGTDAPGAGGGPGTGESNLFGTADQEYSNFTAYSWNANNIADDGIGLDDTGLTWKKLLRQRSTVVDEQIEQVDPLHYVDTGADTAPYWYVRVGAKDRDTSFTVSLNLALALEDDREVEDVDYRMAWDTGHAGNYDVPEAMAWILDSVEAADSAGHGHGRGHGRGHGKH
ncbi:subtype B tannase [Isoptericola aurantiacus]|uniref:subtype B tannase n=1 Tax=Isoptericola aurantiacus TaxID=3377839 RepID=UPI00383B6F47